MAKQVLNVSDGSTSTQLAGGKRLSQIMRGHICNASYPERGFQCSIVLYRFVSSVPAMASVCWKVESRATCPEDFRHADKKWSHWHPC